MIAMALSCNPQLLIADEPTTALDVTIQAQILDILRRLRDQRGMAIIFITHDLGVIAEIADDVLVMFHGKEVEYGPVLDIFARPQAPVHEGPASPAGRGSKRNIAACRRSTTSWKRAPSDGEVRVIEKKMDAARLKQLAEQGRGRLLHPKSELAAIGHPWEEGHHGPDTQTVAEGTAPLLARRKPAGVFSGPPRHPGPHRRSHEGRRRHQLQRLPRPDARPRRRIAAAAKRPPAGPSCGSSSRPPAASIYNGIDLAPARRPRPARNAPQECRSSSRTRTARSTRG